MITFTPSSPLSSHALPRACADADAPAASDIAGSFSVPAIPSGGFPTSRNDSSSHAASATFYGQRPEHPSKGPAGESVGATAQVAAHLSRLEAGLAELVAAEPIVFVDEWPNLWSVDL